MAAVPGFTDNPFQSRADLVRAAEALLRPIQQYRSPGCARVKFQPSVTAHFDDVAAQVEGFARPLWAVAGLLKMGYGNGADQADVDLSVWLRGLDAGTDRNGPEYWGDVGDRDQKMVEMESIAFTLLMAPDTILPRLSESTKRNLQAWLRQINDHDLPDNNWHWFRIFVNLALVKVFGVPKTEVQQIMDDDFARLDSFKVENGWSTDGVWDDFSKQADYYSGSFAIQFAQLLYVHIAHEDYERAAKYRHEAQAFSESYWRYFDTNGGAIPFGRSLTYRFAMSAFWSAAALAHVKLAAPANRLGVTKGMLLRHLRWWSQRPDMFTKDGILTVGFGYSNLNMSEEYNSSQSVYWCLKSFVVLCLPETDPFWTCDELIHPMDPSLPANQRPNPVQVVWPPRHIISNTKAHHFLLSSGQLTKKPHKSREAKYGKFAYSSAFGFNISIGQLIQYVPPDSTLCISIDGGESWIQRSLPFDVRLDEAHLPDGSTMSCLVSRWKPWAAVSLEIETTLVPLGDHFTGWHARTHKIQWSSDVEHNPLIQDLRFVEGGFALHSLTKGGVPLPAVDTLSRGLIEGMYTSDEKCLLTSTGGSVGIVDISQHLQLPAPPKPSGVVVRRNCSVLKAGPNTNLLYPKTSIPTIESRIDLSESGGAGQPTEKREAWLASAVFAVSSSCKDWRTQVGGWWEYSPTLQLHSTDGGETVVHVEAK